MANIYLNYPFDWSRAFIELVGNSINSYNQDSPNQEILDINIDLTRRDSTVTIFDNGPGINEETLNCLLGNLLGQPLKEKRKSSAMRTFQLGLVSTASWIGNKWSIITKIQNEKIERRFSVSPDDFLEKEISEIELTTRIPVKYVQESYTCIRIEGVKMELLTRPVRLKIVRDLGIQYASEINKGIVKISFNGKSVEPIEPIYMTDPFFPQEFEISIKNNTIRVELNPLEYRDRKNLRINRNFKGIATFWQGNLVERSGLDWFFRRFTKGHISRNRIDCRIHLDCFNLASDKSRLIWDLFTEEDLLETLKRDHYIPSYLKAIADYRENDVIVN